MNARSTLAAGLSASGLLPTIYRAVEPAYPEEGCGFIFQRADGVLEVLPTENRAQFLHDKDPERYPHGGADWFEPNMKPWLRASREGHQPRLIFHSHPEAEAYFSQGDRDSAILRSEDGAGNVVSDERHPGVLHMVVSVRKGVAQGAKMFAFDAIERDFVEIAEFDANGVLLSEAGFESV